MALLSDIQALFINGVQVPVKDGTFTANIGGFTNTAVMGSGTILGSTRQSAAGTCNFTAAVPAGTDVRATYEVRDAQIRAVYDTGDEWLMKGAFNTDPPELSGGAGDLAMTYNGKPWKQTKFGTG